MGRSPTANLKLYLTGCCENLPPKGGFSGVPNDFTESKQLFSITRLLRVFKTFLQESTQNDLEGRECGSLS